MMTPTRTYTALIFRGQELAFIESSDDLTALVIWARKMLAVDNLAGYVNTSASIAPSDVEV